MTVEYRPQKIIAGADFDRIVEATQTTELDWREFMQALGEEFEYPKHLEGDFLQASTFLRNQLGDPEISQYQWSWQVNNYELSLVWKKQGEAHDAFIRASKSKLREQKKGENNQPRLF